MVRSMVLPLIFSISFLLAFSLNQNISYPIIQIDKQNAALNFKPETVTLLSTGFRRLIADLVWIQTLMDSDTDHYKKKDLNSWLFIRFSTIAMLDPKFYENYYYGGQYLMVVKDDLIGAEDLFSKGLQHFPADIQLNWQMGYLYGIEMKDPKRALPFFDRIKYDPQRPKFFDSLYTKFSANISGPEEAFAFAFEAWNKLPDGDEIKLRLDAQLYTLKATIDLKSLNQGENNCDKLDFHGNNYIKKEGHWSAPRELINLKFKN